MPCYMRVLWRASCSFCFHPSTEEEAHMVWTCSDRESNPGRQTLSCYCWVKSTGKYHEEGRPVGSAEVSG